MLKQILSISGKPGLYKLVSYGKSMIVVENLENKKRIPAYSRDRIVSLGDIAIYTTEEEVPLTKIFATISKQNEGKALDAQKYKTDEQLHDFFKAILPSYDEERVYMTDIKKIISWYNLLLKAGITEFEATEAANENESKEEDNN